MWGLTLRLGVAPIGQVRRTISDSGVFAFELAAQEPVHLKTVKQDFASEDYTTREK